MKNRSEQANDTVIDAGIDAGIDSGSLRVLQVSASSRYQDSMSRELLLRITGGLQEKYGNIAITERDVARGLPFVSEDWITASYTPPASRSREQNALLALSDTLVGELQDAEVIVIGTPIYNFGIPASLKAWVDLVARVGLTFRYGKQGPVGLLQDKKLILAITSGGTAVGSSIDYASTYLRHVLGFIGITDVQIVRADQLNADTAVKRAAAHEQIDALVHRLEMPRYSAA